MCSDAGTGAKETISDAAVTIRALKNLKTLLNSGVTYIRDAGAPKYIDVDLHDAQLKGEILAPTSLIMPFSTRMLPPVRTVWPITSTRFPLVNNVVIRFLLNQIYFPE